MTPFDVEAARIWFSVLDGISARKANASLDEIERLSVELDDAREDAWTARNAKSDLTTRAEKAEQRAERLRVALDIVAWREECDCAELESGICTTCIARKAIAEDGEPETPG